MAPQLSDRPIITRETLRVIADERLEDARILIKKGRYATGIYVGGYAVECYLKMGICKALDIDELLATFAVHDLEILLLYSGLMRKMKGAGPVYEAFRQLKEMWEVRGDESVRYRDPSSYQKDDAGKFLEWVEKVVQWLRDKTS